MARRAVIQQLLTHQNRLDGSMQMITCRSQIPQNLVAKSLAIPVARLLTQKMLCNHMQRQSTALASEFVICNFVGFLRSKAVHDLAGDLIGHRLFLPPNLSPTNQSQAFISPVSVGMEFWGVEVKAGQPIKCDPATDGKLLHLSQASLGEVKKDKGSDSVPLSVKVGDQKIVIGILSSEKCTHMSLDLVFEKEFELSHNWKHGSVYFCGYYTTIGEEEYPFDCSLSSVSLLLNDFFV
ncbi:histone deacetylase HDT2 [Cinnamomum micranthum f. kanehirae]|uniref:Histone deacetylase HDT2 n=1 Tax=Cinnamomum micranthum f. kanehirae TaxID=337451 RepID=A0A443NVJ6_9MAGN|nr:histone deacetylase HDT2 [Cinnamomum micranthum f. kanehirae]